MFDGFVVMSGGHCTHPTGGPAIRLKHKKNYLGTIWSFIAKRGTNCSEFRIPSGTNWSLMYDLGTIVPKNMFLLITWERAFIKIRNKMVLYC